MTIANRPRRRRTRAESAEQNREALLDAAAEVVGRHGYAGASISRITERAGLAQGTFYNYFPAQQDVFDELMPRLGVRMIEAIRARARTGRSFREKEELSFRGFFEFLRKVPYFLRILNEAEIYAPVAYQRHMTNVAIDYLKFLKRARERGEIARLTDDELEAIVYMLMSTRSYLAMRYLAPSMTDDLPEHVVSAYMALVERGLEGRDAPSARSRPAPAPAAPVKWR